ncbi:MAG: hypothetical protein HY426_00295 [Candidatus Levybacteria bacterium]|nr:hypothetical protein [Candidatus Levybacteria bacterium]
MAEDQTKQEEIPQETEEMLPPAPPTPVIEKPEQGAQEDSDARTIGTTLGTAAILGLIIASRNAEYNDFKKNAKKYAEEKASEWEKNPDTSKATSKYEAYLAAERVMHDNLAWSSEDRAKKWAQKYGDSAISNALDRKKIQYEVYQKNKNWTFQDFKNTAKGYAQRAASDWEKNPSKTESKREAYDRAEAQIHDVLAGSSLSAGQAKKWAEEYNDPGLKAAIERKRLSDEKLKNQSRLRRLSTLIRRQPAPAAPATWAPLPPNTLGRVGLPNVLQGARPPTQAPRQPRLIDNLRFLFRSPLLPRTAPAPPVAAGLRNRLRIPRVLGQRVSKRVKKFLDASNYLQRLFKKSFLGSIVGAATGIITTGLAALAGVITTAVGSAAVIIASIATAAAGISLGAALAIFTVVGIIILLIITLFALLFQPPSKGELPPESPDPAIFYSIVGDEKVPNGQNIKYDIILGYDSTRATTTTPRVENITLFANIPPGTKLVAGQTTGNYDSDSGKIRWKLSENETETDVVTQKSYHFILVLDPDNDITVTTTIGLEGAGIGGGGPPDESGDLFAGADSPPTSNTCSIYGGVMRIIGEDFPNLSPNTNYGDPVCSYRDAKFKKVLELTEINTKNVEFWQDIADCESGSPNGYSPAADGGGTWGRFQMRRGFPNPGKPWNAEDDDRGDIPWQRQIQNAISYNNSLAASGDNFGYWGTAMCLCYYDKYRNQPYCNDIKNNNKVRSPSSGLCTSCTVNKGRR